MKSKDNIGVRMKTYYEEIPKTKLMRRTPVAIRIDGKAFHTFTKGFIKPFDATFMTSMQTTMTHLCENIQGCVLGYTQSDEITLLLVFLQAWQQWYSTNTSEKFYWRQLDAIRNSVQSVGQHYFKQSELQNKSQDDILFMLHTQKNIDWFDAYSIPEKRGSCCIKNKKGKWFVDLDIPIFKNEGREYIERLI